MQNGLYFLQVSDKNRVAISNVFSHDCNPIVPSLPNIPKNALWHFRFGHVSPEKLTMLCKDFPMINVNKDEVCDICHFAK